MVSGGRVSCGWRARRSAACRCRGRSRSSVFRSPGASPAGPMKGASILTSRSAAALDRPERPRCPLRELRDPPTPTAMRARASPRAPAAAGPWAPRPSWRSRRRSARRCRRGRCRSTDTAARARACRAGRRHPADGLNRAFVRRVGQRAALCARVRWERHDRASALRLPYRRHHRQGLVLEVKQDALRPQGIEA